MVQVLPERKQPATPSLESLRKRHCKQLPTHTRTHQKPILWVLVKNLQPFLWIREESRALTQGFSAQSQGPRLPSSGLAHIQPVASIFFARYSLTWWDPSGGVPKHPEFLLKLKRKQVNTPELVQSYSRSACKFQDPYKMKKYDVQLAVLSCSCGKN